MKESLSTTAKIIKRITLDDVYHEIETKTGEIKKRQEEDFRYMNRRIDDMGKKIDDVGGQLNQRIDTVIQMLMEMNKQITDLSKQKNKSGR